MALRQRLEPREHADLLKDTLESYRPTARKASVLLGLFEQQMIGDQHLWRAHAGVPHVLGIADRPTS